MPGNDVSLGAARHRKDGVFGRYSFFIVWEWFVEQRTMRQNLGLQFMWAQTRVLGKKRLGP